jgi:hypothetical protein
MDHDEELFAAKKMDPVKLYDLGDELYTAALMVRSGLRTTAGGDAYEYVGGMNSVETLLDAMTEWTQYVTAFMPEEPEDG